MRANTLLNSNRTQNNFKISCLIGKKKRSKMKIFTHSFIYSLNYLFSSCLLRPVMYSMLELGNAKIG